MNIFKNLQVHSLIKLKIKFRMMVYESWPVGMSLFLTQMFSLTALYGIIRAK